MTEAFLQIPHALLRASHWQSLTTAELIPLSSQDRILWCWMQDRHAFFTGNGRPWFDNQQAIADDTGCSRSTVRRFIADLVKHGYIRITKRKLRGCAESNSYEILAQLQLHSVPTTKVTPPVADVVEVVEVVVLATEEDDVFSDVVLYDPPTCVKVNHLRASA